MISHKDVIPIQQRIHSVVASNNEDGVLEIGAAAVVVEQSFDALVGVHKACKNV